MSTSSIAEVTQDFSKLVDQAVVGEEVAITRDGEVVANLRPAVAPVRRKPSAELLAAVWERALPNHRPAPTSPVGIAAKVSQNENGPLTSARRPTPEIVDKTNFRTHEPRGTKPETADI